jgi:uncharacterized protein (TIGR02284 family)
MDAPEVQADLQLVKNLIEVCRDAQAGYLIAAEHAREAELRTFFTGRSMERARFAAELEGIARHFAGGESVRRTGIVDRINRAWQELKHKLGAGDAGVLENVESFERGGLNEYRQALKAPMSAELKSATERQAESISAAYDQICALRDMGGKAA